MEWWKISGHRRLIMALLCVAERFVLHAKIDLLLYDNTPETRLVIHPERSIASTLSTGTMRDKCEPITGNERITLTKTGWSFEYSGWGFDKTTHTSTGRRHRRRRWWSGGLSTGRYAICRERERWERENETWTLKNAECECVESVLRLHFGCTWSSNLMLRI